MIKISYIFFIVVTFSLCFQTWASMPECIGPKRCRVINEFTVILPNDHQYADKIDCPSQVPPSGVYRNVKKGTKIDLSPVWQFDKTVTSFSCGDVQVYLSEKGDSLLALDDVNVDLYRSGKVIKKIRNSDVNIKEVVAPNLAIDQPGKYDGTMTISKSNPNGFEINNGKGDIFIFDWLGTTKSQVKSK